MRVREVKGEVVGVEEMEERSRGGKDTRIGRWQVAAAVKYRQQRCCIRTTQQVPHGKAVNSVVP